MKHPLIILSILLLSSPVIGEETGVLFLQLENGDVKYYENRIEDRDGKYEGEINNGKPNGQGIESYSDGEEYVEFFISQTLLQVKSPVLVKYFINTKSIKVLTFEKRGTILCV